jgi:hypothetical protein
VPVGWRGESGVCALAGVEFVSTKNVEPVKTSPQASTPCKSLRFTTG